MEKQKNKIPKIIIAVVGLVIVLLSALPVSAVSGNYYQSNNTFSLSYDTTNDVISPVVESNLLLVPNFGNFSGDNYGELLINNSGLVGNDFKVENGTWSWKTLIPWIDTISCTTKDGSTDKKAFSFSRGRLNTEIYITPFVYNLTPTTENPNKDNLACISISRKDKAYYRYTYPRDADGVSYYFTYPRYMSVFGKDFFITGEMLDEFSSDGGYFGYTMHSIDNKYSWLDGEYTFYIEYINMETGEEHTYTFTAPVGNLRSVANNSLRMPLLTQKAVTDLTLSDTFGLANLIYVKNVYCNYDMKYNIVMEDPTDYGTYFDMYTGYIACNDVNIDGTDFDNTIEETWNVAFDKELLPEILASRQRYLSILARGYEYTFTDFIATSISGVLEPKIFGLFGLGDILGLCVALGIVMAFLKMFAGG